MSPTSVASCFPIPPAPASPPESDSADGADAANQPARTFRQVLHDQSNPPRSTTKDAAASATRANGTKRTEDAAGEKKDETNPKADGTAGNDGSAPDGQSVADGEATARLADAKAVKGKSSANGVAGKDASVHADPAAASDPVTRSTDGQNAQALPAIEQSAAAPEKAHGSDGKTKEHQGAETATSTDGPQATPLTATIAATSLQPTPRAATPTTVANSAAQGGEQAQAASSIGPKTSAKSTLRVEEPVQSGKAGKSASKQTAAAAPATDAAPANTAALDAAASTATPKSSDHVTAKADITSFQQQLVDAAAPQKPADAPKLAVAQPAAVAAAPTVADFAAANHAQIVSAVHTQLLPNGGSMHIRLDPPDLGAMQITVRMRDGVMSAEFQASNDQTARLLSHSLGDLKTQLETQGVTVEKLHVSAAPQESRGSSSDADSQRREQAPSDDQRREQQRKEMLRRMWSKLAGGNAPFDMVA